MAPWNRIFSFPKHNSIKIRLFYFKGGKLNDKKKGSGLVDSIDLKNFRLFSFWFFRKKLNRKEFVN